MLVQYDRDLAAQSNSQRLVAIKIFPSNVSRRWLHCDCSTLESLILSNRVYCEPNSDRNRIHSANSSQLRDSTTVARHTRGIRTLSSRAGAAEWVVAI